MSRIVTAIYRRPETAEIARRALEQIGIDSDEIHVIPEPHRARSAGASGGSGRGFEEAMTELGHLDELDLPENELRTYRQCIRHGDHVVSAEMDEKKVENAKKVMQRSVAEAHHIEEREAELAERERAVHERERELAAHERGDGRVRRRSTRARRLGGDADPYIRTYEREDSPEYRDRP